MTSTGSMLILAALGMATVAALSNKDLSVWSRRQALTAAFGLSTATTLTTLDCSAQAFPNRISNQYDDRPKQRGSKPTALGVLERESLFMENDEGDSSTYQGLKPCKPAPDCFCSTTLPQEDPDHSIPPFVWPEGVDQAAAMNTLKEVLEAYQPTPKVDGGGFQIQAATDKYIYVQYESLKNGYIDDVEFAVIDDPRYGERQVQVRSSSRLGYLDYGVNAKRINAIAAALRAKSWKAEGVDYSTHTFYASENGLI